MNFSRKIFFLTSFFWIYEDIPLNLNGVRQTNFAITKFLLCIEKIHPLTWSIDSLIKITLYQQWTVRIIKILSLSYYLFRHKNIRKSISYKLINYFDTPIFFIIVIFIISISSYSYSFFVLPNIMVEAKLHYLL